MEMLGVREKKNTMGLKNTQDFASSNTSDLSNPVRITKNHTNLRRGQTLLRKLADIIFNLSSNYNRKKMTIIEEITKSWKLFSKLRISCSILTSVEEILSQLGGVLL